MKGFREAQARYDAAQPVDDFDWQNDASAEYEAARMEMFVEMVGDDCEGVTGHMGPAETALWQFLACLLVSTSDSSARLTGVVLNARIEQWRDEILARIDRDAIEQRCERNHESRRADE